MTIVGGQTTQMKSQDTAGISRGLEELLNRAAGDMEFARMLFEDRSRALDHAGIDLSESERGILESITREKLLEMINRIAIGKRTSSIRHKQEIKWQT